MLSVMNLVIVFTGDGRWVLLHFNVVAVILSGAVEGRLSADHSTTRSGFLDLVSPPRGSKLGMTNYGNRQMLARRARVAYA